MWQRKKKVKVKNCVVCGTKYKFRCKGHRLGERRGNMVLFKWEGNREVKVGEAIFY